jgi:hypothetical protein
MGLIAATPSRTMNTLGERAADLCFGLSFLLLVFHLASRRPAIFVSFLFIIFTLAWRMLATMYIDLNGPVYSSQLIRDIGPGTATVIHSIAYVLGLMPFFYFFRPSAIESWLHDMAMEIPHPASKAVRLSDVTVILFVLFLAALFLNLLLHGKVPLLIRMERYEYSGGILHRLITGYGSFASFWLGLMFASAQLREHRFDLRMLGLLSAMILYLLLTGNRFSAFYTQISFFVLPWSAVIAAREPIASGAFSWIQQTLNSKRSRLVAVGAFVVVASIVSFAIYNSLTKVRGYEGAEAWNQFYERLLIQPSEVGWASFERVFERAEFLPSVAFNFLFQNPIAPNRNTSTQYLMLAALGEPLTSDSVLRGFQLAGGFPEIFFELFGPYFAWPCLFGAGCIAAALTAYIVRGTLRGDYASAFLAMYILYGFYVMYVGGMLNFVTPLTYWLKITAFVCAVLIENSLAARGMALLPWVFFNRPRANDANKGPSAAAP